MDDWATDLLREAREKEVYGGDPQGEDYALFRAYYTDENGTYSHCIFASKIIYSDDSRIADEIGEIATMKEARSKFDAESPRGAQLHEIEVAEVGNIKPKEQIMNEK